MPVPWIRIAKYAPTILSLTSDLLQRSRKREGAEKSLEARVEILKKHSHQQAEAMHAMAEQLEGLTAVVGRLRRLLLVSSLTAGCALILAILALVMI